jgi:hypothetical protein
MRVSFSTDAAAQAAVKVLTAYGYSAQRFDRQVVTDCPTLLALPALERRVGLAEIEQLEIASGPRPSKRSSGVEFSRPSVPEGIAA